MGRVTRIALGFLVGLGWFVIVLATLLWTAEETGFLGNFVRDIAARELGAVGDDIHLEGVRFVWFDPALEIARVDVGADGSMVRIEDVRIELELPWRPGPRIARVEARHGRVRFSPALANGLQRYSEGTSGRTVLQRRPTALPTLLVEDLALEVETRRWGRLPVGRVDLLLRSNARDQPELAGRMVPSLAASGADSGEVYVFGALRDADHFDVRANATRLPLGTDYLPPDTDLEFMRAMKPRGTLELDAHASIALDGSTPPSAYARLSIQDGRVSSPDGAQVLDATRLDVEATWSPAHLDEWRDPATWSGIARMSGRWNGSTFDADALVGREAGDDALAKAWVHLPDLPVTHALFEAAHPSPLARKVWDGLDLSGSTEAWAGARVRRSRAQVENPVESAETAEIFGVARPAGRLALCYHGMHRDEHGAFDQGFPLPMQHIDGEVAFARAPGNVRSWRLGLFDLRADALPGVVTASGFVQAPPKDSPPELPGAGYVELDIQLASSSLAVDDRLRAALAGLASPLPPAETWQPFHPANGDVGLSIRLMRRAEMNFVAVDLALALRGTSLAWDGLPIPMTKAEGRLAFRSDGVAQHALSMRLEGDVRTGQHGRVGVRLQSQGDKPPAKGEGAHTDELSLIDVQVDHLSLAGDARKAVVARFPDIGSAMDELAPKGFVDVAFERVGWDRLQPYESRVEVVPLAPAEIVPRDFQMITKDVRGRILFEGREGNGVSESHAAIVPITGSWGADAQVAFTAYFPEGIVELRGAGIEPSNKSLLGSLGQLLGRGSVPHSTLDSKALGLAGPIDVDGRIVIGSTAANGRDSAYRFFVRNSSLTTSSGFRLDALRGVLNFSGDALEGDKLTAEHAGTPIDLSRVHFAAVPGGMLLEARFDAAGVPIDRNHLAGFVDAGTLDALFGELLWKGSVDVHDGALSILTPDQGSTRLEMQGRLVPHDMAIRLGLPLEVASASARVERLVYEGGSVRAVVAIDDLNGTVAGRKLESGALLITYVEPNLSIESLDGKLEGGRIHALGRNARRVGTVFSIGLGDPFPFQLALDMTDVQVAGLLRGLFPSGIATRGELDGEVRLSGDLQHLLGITGSGSVRVRGSRLWSVPVFRALFSQLGLDDTAVFDSISANLRIKDGVVAMDDILVRSPLLTLAGKGTLDFDGRIAHDLDLRYELIDRLGLLTRFLYTLQNKLLSIEIRGDMSRPVVVLRNPFHALFSRRRDYRDLPLPGYSSLPPRF